MTLADRIADALAQSGGDPVEPNVLIEARVPLELSGEAVRSRICTFVDDHGVEWALRPDLTLPVALAEIADRRGGDRPEAIRHYRGRVFRLPALPSEPVEYEQIGLERFGAPRDVAQDLWLFRTLTDACQACGVTSGYTRFGDLAMFPAFVDALGFPEDVSAGLKRAFRQEGGVRAYLDGQDQNRQGFAARVAGLPREDIAVFLEDIFAMTGVRPVGERTTDEIVERLYARSRTGAQFTVSPEQIDLLEQVRLLDVPFADAPKAFAEIVAQGGLSGLQNKLDQFAARTEQLHASAPPTMLEAAQFATRFGRRFTYYDGFVFEITSDASEAAMKRPFVVGGRYDALLADLSGGAVSTTALGGVIMPHRLAAMPGAMT